MPDGILTTIGGRPALRFERVLAYPVERVWRALSDPAELERWFPAAVAWTPAPGEALEAHGLTGEITEVEPLRRLAWTFNGEAFSFDLAADGGSCRLTFTHVFDDRGRAAQTAAGWEAYFSRLEPHLDGGHLSEQDAHQGFEEIHEHYAGRFGLDPGPGRQFAKDLRAHR